MNDLIELIDQFIDSTDKYEIKHMLLQIKRKALEIDSKNFNEIGMENVLIRFKSKIMSWLDLEDDIFEHKLKDNLFSPTEKKFILYRILDEVYNAKG